MLKAIKTGLFLLSFSISLLFMNSKALAADEAKVSIDTGTVEEGSDITVKIKISSESDIGISDLWITYDKSVISYISGGETTGDTGKVRLLDTIDGGSAKEIVRELIFKGKKAGTSYIKVAAESAVVAYTEEDMTITATDGKLTVTAPPVASGDNELKKLVVYGIDVNGKSTKLTFKPGFSSDTTAYELEVQGEIEKLSVSATTSHSKATVKIGGLKLREGDNVTTITVKAENGSTKVYSIYTTRAKYEKPTEPTTEESTENKTPEDTTEYIDITLGDTMKKLALTIDEASLPEGFELGEIEYEGQSVQAGIGLSKGLTIVYMVDEDLKNGKFYIYDKEKEGFYEMVNIATGNKLYTIVNTPDEFEAPEGFAKKEITIDGKSIMGYVAEEVSDFVYLYAMNWDGDCALYCYDKVEMTIQRVSEYLSSSSSHAELEKLQAELAAVVKNNKELREKLAKERKDNKLILFVSGILSIIIVALLIVDNKKRKNNKNNQDLNKSSILNSTDEETEKIIDDLINMGKDDNK